MKKSKELKLLQNYVKIMKELKGMGVVRTDNNPSGDYAEYLVAQKLNLRLAPNSEKSFDAIGRKNKKYQIKARRKRIGGSINQLGIMRTLDFDFLVIVVFNENFTVGDAYKIPVSTVRKYAKLNKHQNGYILNLNKGVLGENKTKKITSKFS